MHWALNPEERPIWRNLIQLEEQIQQPSANRGEHQHRVVFKYRSFTEKSEVCFCGEPTVTGWKKVRSASDNEMDEKMFPQQLFSRHPPCSLSKSPVVDFLFSSSFYFQLNLMLFPCVEQIKRHLHQTWIHETSFCFFSEMTRKWFFVALFIHS